MILAIHIVIAISSVVLSTYLFVRPSSKTFVASYTLVGATIASGSILVLLDSVSLVHTCISGLSYTAFTLIAIAATKRKIARTTI